jgi:hypothetical protein
MSRLLVTPVPPAPVEPPLWQEASLGIDRAALERSFVRYLKCALGKRWSESTDLDRMMSLALTVRDRLVERMLRTEQETRAMLETRVVRALGLAAPAELWRKAGSEHPFGRDFRGYVDFVPERYDRNTIEEAIAAVPPGLVEESPLLWGTPEQVASKLRTFGEVGLRHVVLAPISGLVSKRAAIYGLRAMRRIARLLASEQ